MTKTRKLIDPLFIGIYPAGITYADRRVTNGGDYKRVAFLPYVTLELEVTDRESDLLTQVVNHAAGIIARRGEQFEISACGQTVLLGSKKGGAS